MQKQSKQPISLLDNLQELQYRVKRTPEHYVPEMLKAIDKFKEEFEKVKLSPQSKNEVFATLVNFLAQVAELYKNNLSFLHVYLNDLLENYANVMSPFLREKCVGALVVLRNKSMVKPLDQLNTMLKLFRVQDKSLRKLVAAHIMSDIRKLKLNSQNQSIYKQMQNLIFEILKNNSDALAKYSVKIMISMYKKSLWNDAKTVNIISHGCFNDWYKIRLICCFFLIETTVPKELDSSDEEDTELNVQELKGFSKKTRAKMVKQEKRKKIVEKKRKRRSRLAVNKNFFPIDQIYNPQVFCEKLFNILKKNTKDRFEVKVVTMNVLARMIGRHKLFILNFYSYCQKYLYPHQKDVEKFLAFVAEACHAQIPQEEVMPIIKHIITNFVSDRCQEQKITMGINAIREICIKNPTAIDESLLNYIAEYYQFKNKNVACAAKSLINYYRDVNPGLLEKKYRGRMGEVDEEFNQIIRFGEDKVYDSIPGIELLKSKDDIDNGIPMEMDRILDDHDFKKIRKLQQKQREKDIMHNEEVLQKRRLQLMDGESEDQIEEEEEISEEEEEEEEQGSAGEDLEDDEDMISISSGEEIEEDVEDVEDVEEEKANENKDKLEEVQLVNVEELKEEEKEKKKQPHINRLKDESDGFSDIEEESNPHGFITGNVINDYKMSKSEKKKFMRDANLTKEKFKQNRKQKTGGTSNREKLKQKPLSMLRPKKNQLKRESDDKKMNNMKKNIKCLKLQLGHFGKGKAHKEKHKSAILNKKIQK